MINPSGAGAGLCKILFFLVIAGLGFTEAGASVVWFESARRDDLAKIKKLCAAHAPQCQFNAMNSAGETALLLASDAGSVDVVEYLLEHQADVNLRDKSGNPALFYAISSAHDEVAKLLLSHSPDLSVHLANHENFLGEAARHGRIIIVEEIAKTHPELLNDANDEGETAIFRAIRGSHFKLAERLIFLGAKIDLKNKKGQSPKDLAKEFAVPDGHTLLRALEGSSPKVK